MLAALKKIASSYLKREFQRNARRFLEDFTNSVLSTVAVRFKIGQWLSCFCPAIIIDADDHAPLHLCGLLLNGLLEGGWIKGSEVEACRAVYQSFVQEQRQLERSSTRSLHDVGDNLSSCSLQAVFRACQHLFKICIVTNMEKPCDRLIFKWFILFFPGVPANSSHFTRASNFRWEVHHQSRACDDLWRWSAWCTALRAGFLEESALHVEKLFLWLRLRYVGWICSNLWRHHK